MTELEFYKQFYKDVVKASKSTRLGEFVFEDICTIIEEYKQKKKEIRK